MARMRRSTTSFSIVRRPTPNMKALYKYPQRAFPYTELVAENRRRGRSEPEYELLDTGVFTGNRYFDVTVEYAKAEPEDILIRLAATNRGPEPTPLHLLSTLWFRNTWAWGYDHRRPELRAIRDEGTLQQAPAGLSLVRAAHQALGEYWLMCERVEEMPALLFTENESNAERLWGMPSRAPFVKDGINDAVVRGAKGAVNPKGVGTRVAAHYHFMVAAGATQTVLLR